MSFFPRLTAVLIFSSLILVSLPGDELFTPADQYFRDGLYWEAATEYLRFLFFNPGHRLASEARFRIALCLIEEGDWTGAEKQARLSISLAGDDRELHERRFFLAEFLIARGRYAEAEDVLAWFETAPEDKDGYARRIFLAGMIRLYRRGWEEARALFCEYFALTKTYPPETERAVLDLLDFATQTAWKDPTAARVLSYLLPGSGQIYAGDFLEGLNSLVVTGLSAALIVWGVVSGDYIDALAAGFFIFQRFYFGSPYHAGRLAKQSNENKGNAIVRAIFRLLAE